MMIVRASKAVNYFAVTSELPLPWTKMLTKHQQLYLKPQMTVTCTLVRIGHLCLAEDLVWLLNCGCGNPNSLQCLASRPLIKDLVGLFMCGSVFNWEWPWYRGIVNNRMPKHLLYVGSIYYNKLHFIYIKCELEDKEEAFKSCFNADTTVFIKSKYKGVYGIMVCISCRKRTFLNAACCARRVKKTMRRLVRVLLPPRYVWSYQEVACRQAFERVTRFGKCCEMKSVTPFSL